MKVLAINGSARSNGNTHRALEIMAQILNTHKIDVEIIDLVDKKINPFDFKKRDKDDELPALAEKVKQVDGLILGSPTYYSNVTSRMQMFFEGIGTLCSRDDLRGKIGASIAIARRQGANVVYSAMNYFFGIHEMPIATSSYWNLIIAKKPGDIEKDEEGIQTLKTLGKNMSHLLLKLRS